MPMDPAQFYQLGAQAGAARMGGLPENLDKNRQLSMQIAPSLMSAEAAQMAAQTNASEAGYKEPYYTAMADFYGRKETPEVQKLKILQAIMGNKEAMAQIGKMGYVGTGPKQGGLLGYGATPSFTIEDLAAIIGKLNLGGSLSAPTGISPAMAASDELNKSLLALQNQPTI